jgi:hypothetical protein
MQLESGWQKLAFVGMVLAFLAICAVCAAWVVQSLSDANQASLGHWFDRHSSAIWGFIVGFVPAALAYVFGKRVATKQTLDGAQQAAAQASTGAEAAERISAIGRARGLKLASGPR